MPFCPKCRIEFREGFTECSDCGVPLVDTLPAEAAEPAALSREDWKPLARLTSPQYAEMVQGALKAKGIPAMVLSSTGHFGMIGQMGFASYPPVGGAYTVMVRRDHYADAVREAETVLGDAWEGARLDESESGP